MKRKRKEKRAVVVEERPGLLYGLYWGKELLTGSTNRKRLDEIARDINVGRDSI